MLRNAWNIQGYAILASDGTIGTIGDLLFDDASWFVRWLVVDTGSWLSCRRILLPSSALASLDSEQMQCSINLTMQQIKDGPHINTERPVSRQMENKIFGHYGYNPYWNHDYAYRGGLGHMGGAELISPGLRSEGAITTAQGHCDDIHLRSFEEVEGYHIHASDGEIGHVADFLIEENDWTIRYLVVDTQTWWPGKKVLISPHYLRCIAWGNRLLKFRVNREKLKGGPEYHFSVPIDRAYEKKYQAYYDIDLSAA